MLNLFKKANTNNLFMAFLIFFIGMFVSLSYWNTWIEEPLSKANNLYLPILEKYFFLLACIFFIMFSFIYYSIKENKYKKETLYTIIAGTIGFLFLFLIAPYGVPDETVHIKESFAASNMILFVDKEFIFSARDSDVNSYFFQSIHTNINSYIEIWNTLFATTSEPARQGLVLFDQTQDISSLSMNFTLFLTYLPQALGITLARIFHIGSTGTLFLGRIFSFSVYLFLFNRSLKVIPFGKNILFVVGVLPITLQLAASFSYDGISIALTFLLTAHILKLTCTDQIIDSKNILFTLGICIWLSIYKSGIYTLLVFWIICLLWIEKNTEIKNKRKVVILLTGISCIAILFFNVGSLFSGTGIGIGSQALFSSGSRPVPYDSSLELYSFSFIFENFTDYLKVLYQTICVHFAGFISHITITFGWLNISISEIFSYLYVILMIFVSFPQESETYIIKRSQRVWFIITLIGIVVLIMTSMFVGWTPNDWPYIIGVQGRYFLPILPALLVVLFYSRRLTYKRDMWKTFMFLTLVLDYWVGLELTRTILLQ